MVILNNFFVGDTNIHKKYCDASIRGPLMSLEVLKVMNQSWTTFGAPQYSTSWFNFHWIISHFGFIDAFNFYCIYRTTSTSFHIWDAELIQIEIWTLQLWAWNFLIIFFLFVLGKFAWSTHFYWFFGLITEICEYWADWLNLWPEIIDHP